MISRAAEPAPDQREHAMTDQRTSPYVCHVFVCTNDRHGERRSCADGDSARVRAALKEQVAARGWKGRVRVSQSGCLGLCNDGPNVLLYPQRTWFAGVTPADTAVVLAALAEILEREP